MLRRVPPVLIALAIAVVVVGGAIVLSLTTGDRPLPRCTPTPGISEGPLACATSTPTVPATPSVTPSR